MDLNVINKNQFLASELIITLELESGSGEVSELHQKNMVSTFSTQTFQLLIEILESMYLSRCPIYFENVLGSQAKIVVFSYH